MTVACPHCGTTHMLVVVSREPHEGDTTLVFVCALGFHRFTLAEYRQWRPKRAAMAGA